MISLYHHGDTVFHKCPAGVKLLALVALCTGVFVFESIWSVTVALVLVLSLYPLARLPLKSLSDQLRPMMILLLILFLAQGLINTWSMAVFISVRFAALILAAGFVTLTSRTSDMISALETLLRPFSRWLAVEKISLALSLAIRFIPVIADVTREVKEAQRVRGLERSLFAVAMPVIIRTLKMGTHIAEALDARSFDSIDRKGKND
ncbi:energy-coupling factor transporter transmembrane component T family protein [Sneathiella aquimaris]|uniref:energy-coupling factor transporter transmembrane component T family protein n=1 Tax=Sneathiella aquimaris TaxID=2599305 RepID=UPI00146EDAAE|nr:energy-coupling factor transporter transmembrane protein EcfT [Sneathiella aquimaris]